MGEAQNGDERMIHDETRHLCDKCALGVLRKTDGYFACMAPGGFRVTARNRPAEWEECRFYRRRKK